jgi:hypothetical protein
MRANLLRKICGQALGVFRFPLWGSPGLLLVVAPGPALPAPARHHDHDPVPAAPRMYAVEPGRVSAGGSSGYPAEAMKGCSERRCRRGGSP